MNENTVERRTALAERSARKQSEKMFEIARMEDLAVLDKRQHAAASLLDLINEGTSAASMAKSSAKSAPYRLLTIEGAYSQSAQGTLEISFAQDGSHSVLKTDSIKELEGSIVFTPEAAGFWTSGSSFEISNFLLAGDAAVGEEKLSAVAFAGNAKSPSLTAGVESQKGAALVTIHRKQNAYSQYADDKGAASLGKALAAISEVLPSQGEEDFKGLFSALDWSDIEGRDIAQALHSLGPENYDEAARMSLRQQSELNAMLVHRQLLEAPAGSALRASDGKSIWAAPYGSVSRQDAHGSFDSAKSYGYGLMAGINAHIGNGVTAGAHLALASRDTRLSGPSGAQAETDSIYLGLHAKYAPDSWLGGYLLGQLSVGYEDGKMTRRIRAADYARTARSDWHGLAGSVLAGGGWDWTFEAENSSIHLGPVGWLEHMFLKRSSLTEDNAGAASLRVENETYNALSLALGAHAGFKHKMLDGSAFAADVLAAYKHDLTDGDFETKAAFRKFESTGFSSDSETTGRDALLIEAGFGLERSKGLNAKLSFGSELFRNGYYSANFNFNLSWRY